MYRDFTSDSDKNDTTRFFGSPGVMVNSKTRFHLKSPRDNLILFSLGLSPADFVEMGDLLKIL